MGLKDGRGGAVDGGWWGPGGMNGRVWGEGGAGGTDHAVCCAIGAEVAVES